jgi:hypothetical protein
MRKLINLSSKPTCSLLLVQLNVLLEAWEVFFKNKIFKFNKLRLKSNEETRKKEKEFQCSEDFFGQYPEISYVSGNGNYNDEKFVIATCSW